jgi:lipopolysaccharide export system protein LptA
VSLSKSVFLAIALLFSTAALAQAFEVAFGSLQQDTDQPVEVNADSLSVNQNDGTATFTGNVLISQGGMRMSAPEVQVFYNEESSGISRLVATGGVLLVKDQDAAESREADYSVEGGTVVMVGDVLLTQGNNTLHSQKMTVNLETGTAQMEGRVKTILRTGDN